MDTHRMCTAGGHQEMILAQPRHDPVVEQGTEIICQQIVADATDGDRAWGADRHPVEKQAGLRTLDLDLAERRTVDQPDSAAHRPRLAQRCGFHGFAVAWIVQWP
jgi:hypothetical protein